NSAEQPRFTYTARELDSDTGLYYYRARWYDAATGKFMSEDPIDFAGGDQNLYRYVRNSPLLYTDPSGLINWWNVLDKTLLPVEVAATAITGAADGFTMGLTDIARNRMWGEENAKINYPGVYKVGEYGELTVEVTLSGGSAMLKKAASRKILRVVSEKAARAAGKEMSELAARRAAAAAKEALADGLRKQARNLAGATSEEMVHHANTLIGHPPYPGGLFLPRRPRVPSQFPTIGVEWVANNRWNLVKMLKTERKTHVWLHERAYLAEKLTVTLTDPGLTTARLLLNLQRDGYVELDVKMECKR
ncbi:MAG: RHS repeat-associated core domain-containing protein, partial [Pirellulales bacterium]